jgi:1-acyl-sn-glycerol-3-phosphate acyltransferase
MLTQAVAALRAVAFYTGYVLLTVCWGSLSVMVAWAFPFRFRFEFIIGCWTRMVLFWLRLTCGIRVAIEGREHIPASPCIVFVKHESTWETLFIQTLFSPQATLVKRELLNIPFFGWAFRLLRPIAIDRSDTRGALRTLINQGAARLDHGIWVVLFPEGTRVPINEKRSFQIGGAALAEATRRPVLVVAHNSGEHWPAHALTKRPGTIRVIVSPPIDTVGLKRREINAHAEAVMGAAMASLGRNDYTSRLATDNALETMKSRLGST